MKNLRTLKRYFLRYKTKLLLGILFIILSTGFSVFIPLQIKESINEIQIAVSSQKLLTHALLILGAAILAGVFRFAIRETIIVVSREIEYDLRQDFWTHLQRLSLRYFQNNSTGNLMAHATNDIQAVRMFLGPAVMYSIDTFITIVITVSIMLSISWDVTLASLIPLPFLSILVYFVGRKIHERFTAVQESFSDMTTMTQENLSGMRVIKSYVAEMREIGRFTDKSLDYLEKNMHLVRLRAIFMPMLFFITGLSVIASIWYGGVKVIDGSLLLGDITALVLYLGTLIWPMIAFGWVVNIIQQGEASMERLNKIWHEPYEIRDNDKTDTTLNNITGEIEFRDVSFRYNNTDNEVLKNINLNIKPGETMAVMGYTGSGKTTFVNLIPRLYDVTGGQILIDGVPIEKYPLDVLRKNIGFVPQETFLFSDTIRNNVMYGTGEVDEEQVKRAASIAQFDKDVDMFAKKYETMLGERGITMSGGQKQRAALTRALIIDPKILVLDDSFSAVDTHTEEDILQSLREYMKDRTSIIISHRVSTVKDADKIIVIDKGVIAEEGTHEQLLEMNGIYADIHYKQLLEKELSEEN